MGPQNADTHPRRNRGNIFLLLLGGGGVLTGAFYACRYIALGFFFYVCQPALLEEYVEAEPTRLSADNEGRLVYVRGTLTTDGTVVDPHYGVKSQGMGLWRKVIAPENNSCTPPEEYLQDWGSAGSTPPKIGCYELSGDGIDYPLFMQRVYHQYQLAEPMRPIALTLPSGELQIDSANGRTYKVRFLTRKSDCFRFLGRQRGHVLERDATTERRQQMIETQPMPRDAGFRLLRRVGLMLPIAWALAFLGLWNLRDIVARRVSARCILLVSTCATVGLLAQRVQQHIEAGALIRLHNTWESQPELLDAERAATWACLSGALAVVCLAIALLAPLLETLRSRRHAKTH